MFNVILGVPTAIMARKYSYEVAPLWESGDTQGAVKASRRARNWLIASMACDVLGAILVTLSIATSNSGFNNPSAVAASIKGQVQQRLSDKSGPDYAPGVRVISVVCTHSGTDTDHCVITFSSGPPIAQTVTISGDGSGYTAK